MYKYKFMRGKRCGSGSFYILIPNKLTTIQQQEMSRIFQNLPNALESHDTIEIFNQTDFGQFDQALVRIAVLTCLLKNGVDISTKCYQGRTPLEYAQRKEFTLAMKLLESYQENNHSLNHIIDKPSFEKLYCFFSKYGIKQNKLQKKQVANAFWLEITNGRNIDEQKKQFGLFAEDKGLNFGIKEVENRIKKTYTY